MPSALILLFIVLVFVAILTWFIPTSVMTTDEKTGENVICYNASLDEDGNVVKGTGTAPVGIWDVFMAPIKGFVKKYCILAESFYVIGTLRSNFLLYKKYRFTII